MGKKGELRSEFEEFSQKVAALKLLKEEIDALDVKGFEAEAGVIRAKLKNIDAIPEIKKELEELRRKISKRDAKKLISASKRVPSNLIKETGRLQEKLEELKSAFDRHSVIAESSLRRKIHELERAIGSKKRVASKRQLSKKEVNYVKDIPDISREIQGLKKILGESIEKSQNALKEKIKVLEELAVKKRRIVSKKQLSKEEVNYVRDLPDVEKSLSLLNSDLRRHLEKSAEVHREIPVLEEKFKEFKREFGKSNDAVQESINDKIRVLESLIEKKRILAGKKQLSKDEVKAVKEIPVLESRLEMLKGEMEIETKQAYDSLKEKIKGIEELIEKKRILAGKKQLSKDEVKAVKEIPVLESRLEMLKGELEREGQTSFNVLHEEINELQELIERKRVLAAKRQLSKEEVAYIDDIPQLEKQLQELKELLREHDERSEKYDEGITNLQSEFSGLKDAFKRHAEAFKLPVDADVGVAVDKGFGEFLESLKSKLSKEVEEKKESVQKRLIKNIAQQEKEFTRKYRELAGEMHKEYERKVKEELQSEVERRFNEELRKKVEMEREKIKGEESRKKAEELEAEKRELLGQLKSMYDKRRKELEERAVREEESGKSRILQAEREASNEIERKKAEISKKEKDMEEKVELESNEKRKELAEKEREIYSRIENAEEEEKSLIQEELKAIEAQKGNLNIELGRRLDGEKRKLESQLNEIRQGLEEEYKEKARKAEEAQERARAEMEEKERKFREELRKEHERKLSDALKAQKAKIEEEKKEFEEHVMAQARKLFR